MLNKSKRNLKLMPKLKKINILTRKKAKKERQVNMKSNLMINSLMKKRKIGTSERKIRKSKRIKIKTDMLKKASRKPSTPKPHSQKT